MKTTIYDFVVKNIHGKDIDLNYLRGKVVLIVNTASKCGFVNQYSELEKLYQCYKDEGLEILAFPCNQFKHQEPGDAKQIEAFCELNYKISFKLMDKVEVNGKNAHPLYVYLKNKARGIFGTKCIKWNFTKFLVDRTGNKIMRFAPYVRPSRLECAILSLIN